MTNLLTRAAPLARAISLTRVALLLAVTAPVAACGASSTSTASAAAAKSVRPVSAHAGGRTRASGTVLALPAVSGGPPRVVLSTVRTSDGSVITVATFRGPVRYTLHNGSQDPGRLTGHVQAGPSIGGTERTRLLAAFNGGFMMKSLAGGYEQEGHVAKPLRTGLASLVIDRAGRARVGVWGRDVPAPGTSVYSVRQNLWLLVDGGSPTAESARWWRWGGTVGHLEYVARSAVGQNAGGELMFAASMSASPSDLASALVKSGARTAMELDINPEWVQLDVAGHPGGTLRAAVPGQHRPADQYLTGWTRDFITVTSG